MVYMHAGCVCMFSRGRELCGVCLERWGLCFRCCGKCLELGGNMYLVGVCVFEVRGGVSRAYASVGTVWMVRVRCRVCLGEVTHVSECLSAEHVGEGARGQRILPTP